MRENRKTRRGKIAGRASHAGAVRRRRPTVFEARTRVSRGGVRRGCRACRDEARRRDRQKTRRRVQRGARTREDAPPGAPLGAPSARADARPRRCRDGMRRARRVDRRSPRCVGTVASRGRFRALPRGRPRFHRALERRARTPSVAEFFPRFVLASYLGRSHSTEVHGGSCSVFSAGKRDGSRSSRRAVRSARESQTNVVCADVVNSACTEVRRAGGSARKSRDGASTPRTDLERDVLDRAFAQFPEPSIFLSVSFQPRMAVCMSF